MATAEATILIVDDDAAMRKSLRWLFKSVGFEVKTYSSAQEFLAEDTDKQAVCLVLDVRMPGMGGLELQEELVRRGIDSPIVIITGYGDVPMAVRAMKGGAVDFIEKPFHDQDLLDRVRQAIEKGVRKREADLEHARILAQLATLTDREREVMECVAAGMVNKEIGDKLKLSKKTVEVHRYHLMKKLHINSVAELVRMAVTIKKEGGAGMKEEGGGHPSSLISATTVMSSRGQASGGV